MSERLIGFPTTWTPSSSPSHEIIRVWQTTPLRAILRVTGLTIHQLVVSKKAKAITFQLFLEWKAIERHDIAKREEFYLKWLLWVKDLVPVEEWGR